MTLGQRLKLARAHAGLTQKQLEDKSGVSQQTISNIENDLQDKSTDVVQLAMACGVNSEWLAVEAGVMVGGLVVHDKKLIHLLKTCQELPAYGVDQLLQDGDALKELIRKATDGDKGNGASG